MNKPPRSPMRPLRGLALLLLGTGFIVATVSAVAIASSIHAEPLFHGAIAMEVIGVLIFLASTRTRRLPA